MARTRTEAKRAVILRAATDVFARKGFHDVLTEEIAREAGVGKGTLYRYFPTKDDLYYAAVLGGFDEMDAVLADPGLVDRPPAGDPGPLRPRDPPHLLDPAVVLHDLAPGRPAAPGEGAGSPGPARRARRVRPGDARAGSRGRRLPPGRLAHRRRALPRDAPRRPPLPAEGGHARRPFAGPSAGRSSTASRGRRRRHEAVASRRAGRRGRAPVRLRRDAAEGVRRRLDAAGSGKADGARCRRAPPAIGPAGRRAAGTPARRRRRRRRSPPR